MLIFRTRVFAYLAVLLAVCLPGLAHGQDPLVCQLAGKQAKCPGNASLPAGTITSGSLPSVGAAGTYAYPQSVTTDAKGRVTSITAGSAFTLPDVGTPGSYQNPVSITTDAKGRVTSVTVATFSARKALYVDCTVSASGDGSLTSPYKTITEGLAAITSAYTAVYAAPCVYNESLTWPSYDDVALADNQLSVNTNGTVDRDTVEISGAASPGSGTYGVPFPSGASLFVAGTPTGTTSVGVSAVSATGYTLTSGSATTFNGRAVRRR